MITRPYREPRGLHNATRFTVFYVRVRGKPRETPRNAQQRAAKTWGILTQSITVPHLVEGNFDASTNKA
jgi:hypothetical protein